MAGSIPNKDKGILASVDAHVLGQSIDAIGGYFSSVVIGGSDIGKSLDSKVKGPNSSLKCAGFFTRLWIEHNAILMVDLLVDATSGANGNPAGKISSLIRKEQAQITFTGMAGAYQTVTGGSGGTEVLKQVNIKGQVWRAKDGTLYLDDLGEESFGRSHHLQKFRIGVLVEKETDLQLCFGSQDNGVWTVAPLS